MSCRDKIVDIGIVLYEGQFSVKRWRRGRIARFKGFEKLCGRWPVRPIELCISINNVYGCLEQVPSNSFSQLDESDAKNEKLVELE